MMAKLLTLQHIDICIFCIHIFLSCKQPRCPYYNYRRSSRSSSSSSSSSSNSSSYCYWCPAGWLTERGSLETQSVMISPHRVRLHKERHEEEDHFTILTLKTLTFLNKESRPFFLSDNSIWRLASVSSLSDSSIWRSCRLF